MIWQFLNIPIICWILFVFFMVNFFMWKKIENIWLSAPPTLSQNPGSAPEFFNENSNSTWAFHSFYVIIFVLLLKYPLYFSIKISLLCVWWVNEIQIIIIIDYLSFFLLLPSIFLSLRPLTWSSLMFKILILVIITSL